MQSLLRTRARRRLGLPVRAALLLLLLALPGCAASRRAGAPLTPRPPAPHVVEAVEIVPVAGARDRRLVRYPDSISLLEGGAVQRLMALGPLDTLHYSRSGSFFAVSRRSSPADVRARLTLFDAAGRSLWTVDDAAAAAILVADDGRTVVALGGNSFFGGEPVIEFYDDAGRRAASVTGLDFDPLVVGLTPDGGITVVPLAGARIEDGVSLDDRLRAYDREGRELWERVAPDLHFAGQLLALDDRIAAAFYRDGGARHFILLHDRDGTLIEQVDSAIDNRGAYRLRGSTGGAFVAGFGHHHLLVADAGSGAVAWEWEWPGAGAEEFLHDCAVGDDGSVVAVAYSSRTERLLLTFDPRGRVTARREYAVAVEGWGDPRLVLSRGEILVLDRGDNRAFQR